jgi:quercetin dioxygenase-like cupin family protein
MTSPRVVGPRDGHLAILGGTGARFVIAGDDAGKRFALVEHPMQPRALAAPMHRHHREDEYSFVLDGSIGALLGDSVVIGNPGDLIFKPREQWHTFWNASDTAARVLEIISPAGFEDYFRELGAELINGPPDPQRLAALCARFFKQVGITTKTIANLIDIDGCCSGICSAVWPQPLATHSETSFTALSKCLAQYFLQFPRINRPMRHRNISAITSHA